MKWKLGQWECNGHWGYEITDENDKPIAELIESNTQNHSDGQLIAAAPELLETLELITFYFSDSKRKRSSDINYISIAKAAVAKAKGLTTK